MRTKNSIKNTLTAFFSNIIAIIIGLIAQVFFIKILGEEYLGINGLFTNIVSMLGIVEMGIGSAIVYNLYKPIEEKDYNTINALMNFYKKCYHIISIIIIALGFLSLPFLKYFIKDCTIEANIYIIYILFIIETVCSYLLSYKQSLLNANQKNYIFNWVHVCYLLTLNFFQILFLYLTKNFYIYLIIKILFRLVENIILNYICNKLYPYIKDSKKELDTKIKFNILKNVKALFFHKIGAFLVLGTDNIIISRYFGIVTVGLYSNYLLIIDAVQKLFGQAIKVLTPSVGSLLVENNSKKNYEIFKRIRFLNFWIVTFSGVSLLIIMESFITIWIGKEYLLHFTVLIVLVLNYYQKSMRTSYTVFKEGAGIYYEDRFIPIIESILNISASILLLKFFGLSGVFLGTIISGLSLWCYSYPKYVYKKLFKRDYISFAKETIGYILLFIFICFISYIASLIISSNNIYVNFIIRVMIAIIIPNSILLILFYRTENFKYYLNILKKKKENKS